MAGITRNVPAIRRAHAATTPALQRDGSFDMRRWAKVDPPVRRVFVYRCRIDVLAIEH